MPPVVLPPVPGLVKVTVSGSFGGITGANIFHVQSTTPGMATAVLNTLALSIRNAYKARFLPQLSNGFNLGQVLCQDMSSTTGNTGVATGSDIGGDISSGNAPNQVACCLSWHIARHYRGGRPRTYFWGFKNDVMASTTQFTGTFISAMQTAGTNWIADMLALTAGGYIWSPVCVHYYQNGGSTTKPPTPLPTPLVDTITSCSVNARIDTQRRRLGR